jgi:hypothetical protein
LMRWSSLRTAARRRLADPVRVVYRVTDDMLTKLKARLHRLGGDRVVSSAPGRCLTRTGQLEGRSYDRGRCMTSFTLAMAVGIFDHVWSYLRPRS